MRDIILALIWTPLWAEYLFRTSRKVVLPNCESRFVYFVKLFLHFNLKLSLHFCDFEASPTFQLQTLSISLQIFKSYPILTQIRVVETTLVPHLSRTGARSYLLMLSSPKKTLFVNIFFILVEVYTGRSLRHGLSLRAEEM